MNQVIKLVCPLDGKSLNKHDKQYSCENGHSFDIARQGYVNLLPVQHKRSKQPGDSKEMVLARKAFLDSGVYEPVANKIVDVIQNISPGDSPIALFDAGCGEGYYLNYLHTRLNPIGNKQNYTCVGLDISKDAILEAAKRNKQITWVVGTNREPPIYQSSIDIILCVFGFYNFEGFNKVLKESAKIILVEPGVDHLKELREIIYTEVKQSQPNELASAEKMGFTLTDTLNLKFNTGTLYKEKINQLLLMTPHFFRVNKEAHNKLSEIESLDLTVDMVIRILER